MKLLKQGCDLKNCSMCLNCSPEWLPAIKAHRQVRHYKKGETLFEEGQEVKGMFFVTSGLVKVHKKWSDEKELILRFARDGAIAGHRGLGGDTIYPVSATALKPTEVCFVDLSFFFATLKVNPGYLFELMMFFASELKESEKRMRNLAHMNTKGRICQALLSLQEKFGATPTGFINIELSRQDLASYIGTTYETLFKMLNELSEDKIISIEGKLISILDYNKLTLVISQQ